MSNRALDISDIFKNVENSDKNDVLNTIMSEENAALKKKRRVFKSFRGR